MRLFKNYVDKKGWVGVGGPQIDNFLSTLKVRNVNILWSSCCCVVVVVKTFVNVVSERPLCRIQFCSNGQENGGVGVGGVRWGCGGPIFLQIS